MFCGKGSPMEPIELDDWIELQTEPGEAMEQYRHDGFCVRRPVLCQ